MVADIERLDLRSVAIPPLGCGAGGLARTVVQPLITKGFSSLASVKVLLFEPGESPAAAQMPNRTSRPAMTEGRASLLALMSAYSESGLDDTVTALELQKLAYFMQEAGEKLRLRYLPHHYGPYADNLRKVLEIMEGHFINGVGDDGARPSAEIELPPGAREEAETFLESAEATKHHIETVLELIRGFEDAYGLELLATTHWVVTHDPEAARSPDAALRAVRGWNSRKAHTFKPEHVHAAGQRLHERRLNAD